MTNTRPKNLAELKIVFENIQDHDPKIKVGAEEIKILPFYWNYSFITNFFPLIVSIYVFTQTVELRIYIAFGLIAICTFYLIWLQLNLCNTIVIDTKQRKMFIEPNPILGKLKKHMIVPFTNIKTISFSSDGSRPSFRRYVIVITLKNTEKKIKLISTNKEDNAKKLVAVLIQLL